MEGIGSPVFCSENIDNETKTVPGFLPSSIQF